MQSLKKKLTLDSKNDMRNLVNFNLSSGKSENLHFDVLLLSIAYKVSAEKVQKNYLSWHWKEIQTLKKNWLFVWKITWGIWWTLTRAAESLRFALYGLLLWKLCTVWVKQIQRSCVVKSDTIMSNFVNFDTRNWKLNTLYIMF